VEIEVIRTQLATAWERYQTAVDNIAEAVFRENVLPFLKNNGLPFSAGMGIWAVGHMDDRYGSCAREDDTEEWKAVRTALSLPIEGMACSDLGSLMPDYHPK